MAEPTPSDGDNVTRAPKSFWAESAQSAKAWAAVAAAFFAVVALAAWLFSRHQSTRQAQIDAQYAQNAARFAQQVELKHRNYRAVVDNVTRVLSTAAEEVVAQRQRTLASAREAQRKASERETQLKNRLDLAGKRRRQADEAAKQHRNAGKQASDETQAREDAYRRAEDAVSAAESTMATANREFLAAAATLLRVQQELNQAESEVAKANAAMEAASLPVPTTSAATPTAGAPSATPSASAPPSASAVPTSSAPPAIAAAPPPVGSIAAPPPSQNVLATALKEQEAKRNRRKNDVEAAREAFQRAQQKADAAWQAVSDRDAEAEKAWLELKIADDILETVRQRDSEAQKKLEHAKTIEQNSIDQYQEGLTRKQAADVAVTASVSPAVDADNYLNGLEALVLPSHVQQLRSCRGLPDTKAVQVCVAQRIAALNDVQGMEIVACPTGINSTFVTDDARYLLIPPSSKDPAVKEPPACGRVKLSRLLTGTDASAAGQERPVAQDAFETVLLLRRDGTTLHSLGSSSNIRVLALPGFQENQADASRVQRKVAIGSSDYRAFLQPIRLRLSAPLAEGDKAAAPTRERADLLLCGLVPENRLERASNSIALPLYLWFVLFLSLGLLSLPLAKLWLLGPTTSFTRFDVTLLATSAALLNLLGPVVTLAFVAHNRLDERADRQATHVAMDVEDRLRAQISAAGERLHRFNSDRHKHKLHYQLLERPSEQGLKAQRTECTDAGGTLARGILFEGSARGKSVCEGTYFPLGARASGTSPGAAPVADWQLIFLLDNDGDERVKLVPKDHDSTPVSVKSRGYFQRAQQGDTACLDERCEVRGAPELVRSITSGRLVLMVAQPICENSYPCPVVARDELNPMGVAALETDMTAFRKLSLPLGMQAAVVDESGHIMLHSDNDAHHEQNLFGEVDQPHELRASLLAKVPQTLHLNYLGQLSRLHVEPLRLPGSGWSVVVIAPTSIVDVATTDMVLATLFGYGMLLLLALVLVGCGLVVRQAIKWGYHKERSVPSLDRKPSIGLRPHAQRSEAYADLAVWTLGSSASLVVLAMFTTRYLPTTLGLVAALGLCIVTVVKLVRIGSQAVVPERDGANVGPRASRPWRELLPLTYTLCIAGLTQVFIMGPAAVLFNGAYTHVVDNLVRAEQDHLASVLRRRSDCFQSLPAADGTRKLTKSCADVFTSGEERRATTGGRGRSEVLQSRFLSPLPYLADLLPAIGPADLDDRGRLYRTETVGQAKPAPSEFVSERQLDSLALVSTVHRSVLAETSLPPLFGVRYHFLSFTALLLVCAAAVAAAYVVGFRSLRRLYFLDLLMRWRERVVHDINSLIHEANERYANDRKKVLVLHPSRSVLEALAKQGGVFQVELDEAEAEPPAGSSGSVFVVRDLEPRAYDAEAVRRLAQVSAWNAPVIVLSVNEPGRAASLLVRRTFVSILERFDLMEATAGSAAQRPSQSPQEAPVQAPCSPQVARAWLELSDVERRLLAELAINGYATPHPANIPALKSLATRGLLDPDTLTIADEELARFARESTSPAEQAQWAEADRGTAWASLRVPLSTGVVALFATLTASKPELGVASAIVPTLAAGLPTVLRILSQMVAPKVD